MDDHSLRVLEFPRVLDLLAAETAFSVGRELALALRPATSHSEVLTLQSETAELVFLDQSGIDIPFAGAKDIRTLIHAAAIGQALEPSDLADAAQVLRTAWRARTVVGRVADRVPLVSEIAAGIADFRRFVEAVDEAITPRGEVADSASEQLAATRRELRAARDRLEQRAQAALADAIRRGLAQDGILTERNGRKVIPLKADSRGQLAGIVHDVSSSGATVFLEPMSVVEAGNQVRELQLAEDREVRRVLQRLTALLGVRAEEAQDAVLCLGRLDLLNAKARLGKRLKAQLPPPGDALSWLRSEGETRLVRARHPLLRGNVVPIDLTVGDGLRGVLITGPNTGGKTVALKTLGLLCLMVQAGLPPPCDDGSRFTVFSQVFADIGDEQSIEQSLSTFSSHMRNVIHILERAGPGTLVLLDELGAGTDPTEGAALARAVLEVLLDRGCIIVATTHHGELKAFAQAEPRLANASVEFDLETLSPTYHLTVGLPGQSNAIAIARRLGLSDDVLGRAESQLSPEHFELEALLADIRSERSAAAEARQRGEHASAEIERLRLALAAERDSIEQERADVIDAARHEAESELAAVRRDAEAFRRRASASYLPADADSTLHQMDAALGRLKARARPTHAPSTPSLEARPFGPGDLIHVRDIPQVGEALSSVGEDGRVEVQFGSLRMKVSVDRIDRVEPPSSPRPAATAPEPPVPAHVPLEIDLRGSRAEEALNRLDGYLDDAFRSGMPFVRIIHGKGTGALRAAIREELSSHPLVRRLESAGPREGGEGVTVAILAG